MFVRAQTHCYATLTVKDPSLVNVEDLRVLRTVFKDEHTSSCRVALPYCLISPEVFSGKTRSM
jgi:hypothetical protein